MYEKTASTEISLHEQHVTACTCTVLACALLRPGRGKAANRARMHTSMKDQQITPIFLKQAPHVFVLVSKPPSMQPEDMLLGSQQLPLHLVDQMMLHPYACTSGTSAGKTVLPPFFCSKPAFTKSVYDSIQYQLGALQTKYMCCRCAIIREHGGGKSPHVQTFGIRCHLQLSLRSPMRRPILPSCVDRLSKLNYRIKSREFLDDLPKITDRCLTFCCVPLEWLV